MSARPPIQDPLPDDQDRPATLDQLLSRLNRVKKAGSGWKARCPAHDDQNPSLSISVAADGRPLVHCFAGCSVTQVLEAAGLGSAFLSRPPAGAPAKQPRRRRGPHPWSSPDEAGRAIARRLKAQVKGCFIYESIVGSPRLAVVRFETATGKTFRPLHYDDKSWFEGDPQGPLPLFRLSRLAESKEVLVVEGEGCVAAAESLGVVATTSAHGSNSAAKTDWSPVADKRIVIWPDHDDPGRKYGNSVVAILRELNPLAEIRVIDVNGLPEGGDIVDWIASQEAAGLDPEEIRERLAILMEGAGSAPREDSAGCADSAGGGHLVRWQSPLPIVEHARLPSFPIDSVFPKHLEWMRDFCLALSECHQVPIDAVAMLALPTMALGLAKRFEVEPQRGWHEQLSLYVVVLLASGERKTAVMRELVRPIYEWQREIESGMADLIRKIDNEEHIAKTRLDQARRKAARSQVDDLENIEELTKQLADIDRRKPRPPSLVMTEGTSEAIARTLVLNSERAILASAEGDAFDIMLGRYSGNPNFGVWLAGHSGDSVDSVRRGREPDRLAHPALQVALSIQPDAIANLLSSRAAKGRGVLARFFFSIPESKVGYRTLKPEPIPPQLVDRFGMRLQQNLSVDVPRRPIYLTLSEAAQEVFLKYREKNEVGLRPDGDLALVRSWGSKLPGGLARVAGILHAFEPSTSTVITRETIECALALHDYLLAHYTQVSVLAGDDEAIEIAQRIDAWVRRSRLTRFSARDAFDKVRSRGEKMDDFAPALELLQERRRIRALPAPPTKGPGRPPSPEFEVNPELVGSDVPQPQNPHIPHNSREEMSRDEEGQR